MADKEARINYARKLILNDPLLSRTKVNKELRSKFGAGIRAQETDKLIRDLTGRKQLYYQTQKYHVHGDYHTTRQNYGVRQSGELTDFSRDSQGFMWDATGWSKIVKNAQFRRFQTNWGIIPLSPASVKSIIPRIRQALESYRKKYTRGHMFAIYTTIVPNARSKQDAIKKVRAEDFYTISTPRSSLHQSDMKYVLDYHYNELMNWAEKGSVPAWIVFTVLMFYYEQI